MNINFIKDYKFSYYVYNLIRKNFKDARIRIYIKDNKFYHTSLYKDNEIKYYTIELLNKNKLNNKIDNAISEKIIFLYPDIKYYKRCLKSKYYIDNDIKKDFKNSTYYNLNICLKKYNNDKIFNMLDLEIFKHYYFIYNSILDLLDLYDKEEIIINNEKTTAIIYDSEE
jgi:hypothetical protein